MSCFSTTFDYLRQCIERFCCYSDSSRRTNAEDEQLLSDNLSFTTEAKDKSIHTTDSSMKTNKEQVLLVMRHGLRQDEVDSSFILKSNRPWDPPLASRGRNQAASIVSLLGVFSIDYIISSPFLRCLQTSAEVLVGLGLDLDHLIIDGSFSEIYGPRTLTGFDNKHSKCSLEEWMWNGARMEDAIDAFIRNEPCFCGLEGSVTILDRPLPNRVENVEKACKRYKKEIDIIADQFLGFNVLIISHGEAVRTSVNRLNPDAMVYETRHVSFTSCSRLITLKGDETGETKKGSVAFTTSPWTFNTRNGSTGVSWIE
eukprot:g8120.t1